VIVSYLVGSAGVIFVALGFLHGVYTLLDFGSPRRFAPVNISLIDEMKKTRVRLRKDVRNFWLSYLGFNLSHSLGAMFFGFVMITIAIHQPGLAASPTVMAALFGVACAYAVISYFCWFKIPLIGSVLSAALIAAGYLAATAEWIEAPGK